MSARLLREWRMTPPEQRSEDLRARMRAFEERFVADLKEDREKLDCLTREWSVCDADGLDSLAILDCAAEAVEANQVAMIAMVGRVESRLADALENSHGG